MRKKMLIGAIVSVLLLLTLGYLVWRYLIAAPLYTPGMVQAGTNLRGPLEPPPQAGDGPYWQVEEDIRLHFTTQGEGRPILVVHGGPGFPIRGPLAGLETLTRTHKLFYYDQRGCGRSTRPFDRFSSGFYSNLMQLERTLGIGAQIADIERVRRILGEEKLILMGHSFGGFLAALYAAEFPEHVEAMVLVAPAGVLVMPDEGEGLFEEIGKRLPRDRQAEYARFLKDYLDFGSVFSRSEAELASRNRRLGEYFLAASGEPGEAGQPAPPEDNGGWMVQALYFSMGMRHDYRPALKRVQAHALILHGERDVSPERGSRMYAQCLPNARLHVMKDGGTRAGHFPFSEQPEAFARVVSDFLAGKQ
jgi:proline iminopeptidase